MMLKDTDYINILINYSLFNPANISFSLLLCTLAVILPVSPSGASTTPELPLFLHLAPSLATHRVTSILFEVHLIPLLLDLNSNPQGYYVNYQFD